MSLSEYLLEELTALAERPSLEEWARRVRTGDHLAAVGGGAARAVRAERDR